MSFVRHPSATSTRTSAAAFEDEDGLVGVGGEVEFPQDARLIKLPGCAAEIEMTGTQRRIACFSRLFAGPSQFRYGSITLYTPKPTSSPEPAITPASMDSSASTPFHATVKDSSRRPRRTRLERLM